MRPEQWEDCFYLIAKSTESLAEQISDENSISIAAALTTPEVGAALSGLADLPAAIRELAEAIREIKV